MTPAERTRPKRTTHAHLVEISRPTGASARDLRDRVLRRYQAGGSAWSSLEDFARAEGLPWPDALDLVTQTSCTVRLREAILTMERR